ncbi:MAG: hypothetical protein ACK4MT_05760 [Thermaurantiacus tibetensis]|uniref:hypothetical protein n=1 Tax=Thermaurantiacus tibetensis TaxID=2759035 RepID=UPI00188FDBB3|nr:hypothetical protein [Thermaurantiacus tibetensis]
MSADLPLFRWQERYPGAPGFKRQATSAEAATSMRDQAGRLRGAVLAALRRHGPLTADEIAGALGETVLSVRPRVSELAVEGLVVKTSQRRRNDSGRTAIVWRLA